MFEHVRATTFTLVRLSPHPPAPTPGISMCKGNLAE